MSHATLAYLSHADVPPPPPPTPAPGGEHILIYKAETNRCERLEWRLNEPVEASSGCTLVLRQARARNLSGPWVRDGRARGGFFPGAISKQCVEGPAVLKLQRGRFLLLFDQYRSDCFLSAPPPCGAIGGVPSAELGLAPVAVAGHGGCNYTTASTGFGAMLSTDLRVWSDVSARLKAPAGYKHGTPLKLTAQALRAACGDKALERGSPLARSSFCAASRSNVPAAL